MLARLALSAALALVAGSAIAGTVSLPASAPEKPAVEAKRGTALSPMLAKSDLRGPKTAKVGMVLVMPAPSVPSK